ncbi:GNAT family N-acetyltransferase [Nocardia sp. NPDC056100]|uniref:GNAT family N-acetyltransferase n=1 Tax=Nocardia sp. NPDC056100 TaxID=3345712 RepID=UPI0035E134D0
MQEPVQKSSTSLLPQTPCAQSVFTYPSRRRARRSRVRPRAAECLRNRWHTGHVDGQLAIRRAAAADYDAIIGVVDGWWGRPVTTALPRLFLEHFAHTSLIAERDGVLAGFLIGFVSPDDPRAAYIHFAGIDPDHRGTGLARDLYNRFIAAAKSDGREVIRAITSPNNVASIAFHKALGFDVGGPIMDYNGPHKDMVTFELHIPAWPQL